MNPFFYSLLISIVLINGVYNVRGDDCKSASNSTCESCLKISGCAFCKTSKECFARPSSPVSDRCPTGDLQIETCIGKEILSLKRKCKEKAIFILADAKTWLIILGTVGGVVLIVVIIIICCCCRKCKQRALLQLVTEKRQTEYLILSFVEKSKEKM